MALEANPVGEWRQLLQDTLGKEEGAAVAASLSCRKVVINVAISEKDQASGQGGKKTNVGTQKSCALTEGHGDVENSITLIGAQDNDSTVVPVVITEESNSVLHVVAAAGESEGHLECARRIYLKASHLLTTAAQNSKGDTPLHCAVRAKNNKMAAHLIELAKGVHGIDYDRASDLVSDYDRASDLVSMRNKRGETALHEAIRLHNRKMVQKLMSTEEKLAQINAEDGTSPLYLASLLGHHDIVHLILDKGKNPSYSGPRQQNALHAAVLHNNTDGIYSTFVTQLKLGPSAIITELLLKWKKELVNETDMYGSTPLHFAASAPVPSLQFIDFVLYGKDLGICSSHGVPSRNLMQMWCELKFPLLQLLEADPTAAFQADNRGSFPVHVAAASRDSMRSLRILLTKYPGCAGLRDADGRTFLHIAVQKKRGNAVKFVNKWCWQPCANKSVMNVQDNNGDTALHLAVRDGELDMSRSLIRNSHVDINLENNQGKTPMDLAAGGVKPGFYFALSAPRRILNMLTFAEALTGSHRYDKIQEYDQPLDEETESDKIKEFAQIVGIGSVLVSTATFTAALTMPGGVWTPGDTNGGKKLVAAAPPLAGTPVLNGSYAFDGFVISNTLAFICATLATFSLVYCGVAAVDIQKRFKLVSFSLALLLCSARSFCAAFAFALYMLLAKVALGTAIASILMTSFALLDALWFLLAKLIDTRAVMRRKTIEASTLWKLAAGFVINLIYLFWPYLIIGGYMYYDYLKLAGKFHGHRH